MLAGTYNPWLVVLSVLIAIAASYAALAMASRTAATTGRLRRLWLGGGALAMGAGVWSMHYIGMLAFDLPTPVLYDIPTVALSLSAAIFASAVALYVVSRTTLQWVALTSGGLVMGAGISAMHYIGMAAMHLAAQAKWNFAIVGLSILIAVIVSMVALYLAFHLRSEARAFAPRKLASATLMGFAIIAMHYTGMAAASFHSSTAPAASAYTVNVSAIGVAGIALVTFLVLGLALVAAIFDRRFTTQQDAHQREEKRHRDLIQRSPAGVHWSNMDGRITDCNEACARILGYDSREALLHDPDFKWDNTGATRDQVMANFGPDGRLSDFECWLTRKDGTPVCVVANATLLTSDDGKQIIEGTMIDITARKIAEDELRASGEQLRAEIAERERMETALHLNQRLESVGQLAAGIAHEINTPVQFVNDSVHFLRDSLADYHTVIAAYQQVVTSAIALDATNPFARAAQDSERACDLAYMLEHAPNAADRAIEGLERIATIVRSMKEFAHPDQAVKSYIDLNRAVMTTLDVARHEFKYIADVITDLGDLPAILCYSSEINQVMLNLVVNAAHAIADNITTARGQIRVTTRWEDQEVVLEVSDSGCGIPEEIRTRIFDPFFTTKEVGRGTGQGLAITRTIVVDKHCGTIGVESEVGVGTTFTVRLPQVAMAAAA